MLSINMEEISSLMNDIHLITKVKFDLYDKHFNIIQAGHRNMCHLCSMVRSCKERHEKCIASDRIGFLESTKSASSYTYKCHMGLTESVTPIMCEGEIVGYIMMGQKLMKGDREAVRENIEGFPDAAQRGEMLEALEKMKYTSEEELNAMRNLVEMCASYLMMKKLIKHRETPIEVLLKSYVEEHIADELDIKAMCREFKISKSGMYVLSKKSLGMGITDYIRNVRTEKAKELLENTDLPISAVAEMVGYSDSNYFTKVFKKMTAKTPSQWRNKKDGLKNSPNYL